MNVFKIFATMSLVDAISKPLAKIQSSLKQTGLASDSLSGRLGRLAGGFGKVAIPAAMFLGTLGAMTGEAIAFESKMADVAKVVDFESPAALKKMSEDLQDLSLRIPMTAEGFADIAAAAASSVGESRLLEFSEMAAKMGVAFDVSAGEASEAMVAWRNSMALTLDETYALADAVNHVANKMGGVKASGLTAVLNAAGASGKLAGLTAQQVAAMGGAALSAGADSAVAATGLRSVFDTLSSGAAMTDTQAKAFGSLGFSATELAQRMQTDAEGAIMDVLAAFKKLPAAEMGGLLTQAFGDVGKKTLAPMIGNLDNLRQAFALAGDAAGYAGSMEAEYASRSATTENSLQLMKNSFNVLCITIGNLFLPVIDAAAKGISFLVQGLVAFGRSPAGAFLIKLAAGIAAALVGVTGLVAALALLKPVVIMVSTALSGVFWPVLAIAGVVALVAAAWKSDFMGLASSVTGFASKIKLVFKGVSEIFATLVDGKGQLSADLAGEIEAAGLMGLVTTVGKIAYRIQNFFQGVAAGISEGFGQALESLRPSFEILLEAAGPVMDLFSKLIDSGEAAPVSQWAAFGKTIGSAVVTPVKILAAVLSTVIKVFAGIVRGAMSAAQGLGGRLAPAFDRIKAAVGPIINFIGDLIGKFVAVGDSANTAAGQTGVDKWVALGEAIGSKLVGAIEEIIHLAVDFIETVTGWGAAAGDALFDVVSAIENFSLIDAGTGLINGFTDGIKAGAETLMSAVSGVLERVRGFLPFSDAKEGPLSNLTASGSAFISTFADGIMARAESLIATISGILGRVRGFFTSSDAKEGPLSDLTASGMALPETYAQGISAGAPALLSATENMLNGIDLAPPYFEMPGPVFGPAWDNLTPQFNAPAFAPLNLAPPYFEDPAAGFSRQARTGRLPEPSFNVQEGGPGSSPFRHGGEKAFQNKTINLHIGRIELPNVEDADGFVAALEAIVEERA